MSKNFHIGNLCVYRKNNQKWSFYDEKNRPTGAEYETIEHAVDALYQYLNKINLENTHNVQYS